MKSIRTSVLAACVGAAAIAAFAGSANAVAGDSFTYNIVENSSERISQTNLGEMGSDLGALYGNSPVVSTDASGNIILTFSLSPNFNASTPGNISKQSTTGYLVLDVSFSEPIFLTAMLKEGGGYITSRDDAVDILGSKIAIKVLDPVVRESDESVDDIYVDFASRRLGSWAAEATTLAFSEAYMNYRISIDNVLIAETDGDVVSISKTHFQIILFPAVGDSDVPEPASLSVLGIGVGALLFRRRRA